MTEPNAVAVAREVLKRIDNQSVCLPVELQRAAAVITSSEAKTVCTALLETDDRARRLHEFAQDVADHGLRHDLTPTMFFTGDDRVMYSAMCEYMRQADAMMRDRAKRALAAPLAEETP